MSMSVDEYVMRLKQLLDQTLLIHELLQRESISLEVYKAWLDAQWGVIHQLHGQIRDMVT